MLARPLIARLVPAAAMLTLVSAGGAGQPSPVGDPDVRQPLEAYILGHRTGEARHMDAAFHPTARMTYMADTGMVTVPITDYIGGMRDRGPRATPDTFPRTITMVDVMDDAAIARIDMTFPTSRFTDYMTLLRFEDGWRIVNKSFHRAAR